MDSEAIKKSGSKHLGKRKKRKRRHSSSSSSSEQWSEDSFDSNDYRHSKKKKKHSHKEKKLKKHKKKHLHHDSVKKKKRKSLDLVAAQSTEVSSATSTSSIPPHPPVIPGSSCPSKPRGPMTREEYEKQQSVVRRVFDPDTGRHRLVKGDGEIIEEIVSKDRHKAINKLATLGDGLSFQSKLRKLQ